MSGEAPHEELARPVADVSFAVGETASTARWLAGDAQSASHEHGAARWRSSALTIRLQHSGRRARGVVNGPASTPHCHIRGDCSRLDARRGFIPCLADRDKRGLLMPPVAHQTPAGAPRGRFRRGRDLRLLVVPALPWRFCGVLTGRRPSPLDQGRRWGWMRSSGATSALPAGLEGKQLALGLRRVTTATRSAEGRDPARASTSVGIVGWTPLAEPLAVTDLSVGYASGADKTTPAPMGTVRL